MAAQLSRFSVAITADRRRQEQAVLLSRLGMTVKEYPLLNTNGADQETLRELTQALTDQPPHLFLANTGYGMRAWFGLARGWGMLDALAEAWSVATMIGARGAKALGELRKAGLDATYRARSETLEELVAWALAQAPQGKRVAFQLHGEASEKVVAQLGEAGAKVTAVTVYHMANAPGRAADQLIDAIVVGDIQVVTFTAAPQLEVLGEAARARGLLATVAAKFNSGAVIAACIGPVCAGAAHDLGILQPLLPEHTRLGSLATAIEGALSSRLRAEAGLERSLALGPAEGGGPLENPSPGTALHSTG